MTERGTKVAAYVRSDFEDFLREEGRLEEATVLALELQKVMKWQNVSGGACSKNKIQTYCYVLGRHVKLILQRRDYALTK